MLETTCVDGYNNIVVSETLSKDLSLQSKLDCTSQSFFLGLSTPKFSSHRTFDELKKSIIELLFAIGGNLSTRSELQSANLALFNYEVVPHFYVE